MEKERCNEKNKPGRFELGIITATPGALEAFSNDGTTPSELLDRHVSGDWGDLCEDDKQENELSIQEGFRIFSAYVLKKTSVKIWVITEADRSVTTLLLPSEY